MEPQQREAYEAEIAEKIKQRMGLKTEVKETGSVGE
jgi:hypothetical protein